MTKRKKKSQAQIYIERIGAQVKARRRRKRISLKTFARRCHWTETLQVRMEAGQINFSLAQLEWLEYRLNCTLWDLCQPLPKASK